MKENVEAKKEITKSMKRSSSIKKKQANPRNKENIDVKLLDFKMSRKNPPMKQISLYKHVVDLASAGDDYEPYRGR
jgi:hypothetical protein